MEDTIEPNTLQQWMKASAKSVPPHQAGEDPNTAQCCDLQLALNASGQVPSLQSFLHLCSRGYFEVPPLSQAPLSYHLLYLLLCFAWNDLSAFLIQLT